MMIQFTVLASKTFVLLITNDTPAVLVPTVGEPTLVNAPVVASVKKMMLLAVTAVVLTVTVPPESVAVPILAFEPVVILSLLPAVASKIFPVTTRDSVGSVTLPIAVFELRIFVKAPAPFCLSKI